MLTSMTSVSRVATSRVSMTVGSFSKALRQRKRNAGDAAVGLARERELGAGEQVALVDPRDLLRDDVEQLVRAVLAAHLRLQEDGDAAVLTRSRPERHRHR